MNLSELCIRRPVLTTLLTVSFIVVGIFAYRLMHQAQCELAGLEGARIVRLGRTAGTDIAHLCSGQIGEAAASGKRIPIEALVRVAPDEGPHLALQVEPIGLR